MGKSLGWKSRGNFCAKSLRAMVKKLGGKNGFKSGGRLGGKKFWGKVLGENLVGKFGGRIGGKPQTVTSPKTFHIFQIKKKLGFVICEHFDDIL